VHRRTDRMLLLHQLARPWLEPCHHSS
jgi:hypothetical protein